MNAHINLRHKTVNAMVPALVLTSLLTLQPAVDTSAEAEKPACAASCFEPRGLLTGGTRLALTTPMLTSMYRTLELEYAIGSRWSLYAAPGLIDAGVLPWADERVMLFGGAAGAHFFVSPTAPLGLWVGPELRYFKVRGMPVHYASLGGQTGFAMAVGALFMNAGVGGEYLVVWSGDVVERRLTPTVKFTFGLLL